MAIRKSTKFKITIIILSLLLVLIAALCAYLVIQFQRQQSDIDQLKVKVSQGESWSVELEDKFFENYSLQDQVSRQNAERESYNNRLSEQESSYAEELSSLKGRVDLLDGMLSARGIEVPDNGQTVYLTFDDGPSSNTPKILDILDSYNVKATFFVINGSKNKYMKDIVSREHTIALHSYSHNYSKIYKSEKAYFEDLDKIHEVVYKQTGVDARIIRFPGGASNTVSKNYSQGIMTRLTKEVTNRGFVYFDWNVTNGDATGEKSSVEKQLSYVSQYPKKSKTIVVLMHDTDAKDVTVESLPQIIEYYQSQGMNFGVLTQNTPPVQQKVNN